MCINFQVWGHLRPKIQQMKLVLRNIYHSLTKRSFEPEFGNPRKTECFQFSVNFFIRFYWSVALNKPQQRNLEFWTCFSVISFLCSAAREWFQSQLFKTWLLTQPDFENSKNKSIFNLKKTFLVYFKRASKKMQLWTIFIKFYAKSHCKSALVRSVSLV